MGRGASTSRCVLNHHLCNSPRKRNDLADSSRDPNSITAPAATKTKTDSGITHTIPNNSVVTVTKHTVIFSEAPSVSTTSLTTAEPESTSETGPPTPACQTCSQAPASTARPPDAGSLGISSGAIAGAATGAAVILALVVVICVVSRRRARRGEHPDPVETETLGRRSPVEGGYEKHAGADAHCGSDPFAPFGGRADQTDYRHRPPSGTFEMDGTGIAPVELPAVSVTEVANDGETVMSGRAVCPVKKDIFDPTLNLGSANWPTGKYHVPE
ncbi:hypothetical protein UVI_02040100 [Ustilaginoidea virens]|nr:hypothetical protein UVI_02040100 [Ustilaginoidea virens]